ncbi:hypothetical protein CKAH01_12101 [Colletotrichum kahawae]|uniref:Uncharacterized protein n=1 Tax=Colletotrichum kahawae TaxID=34407 RepID=A0AAE0DCX5_COLKA|nr:hypothetical protein CKAH01_12101 [Colletotrichum kahawae]
MSSSALIPHPKGLLVAASGLRPRKIREQATKHDVSVDNTIAASAGGSRIITRSTETALKHISTQQPPIGYGSPITLDKVCNVPRQQRRRARQNGITSCTEKAPDTRHATIDAAKYYRLQTDWSPVAPSAKKDCRPFNVRQCLRNLCTSSHTQ